MPPGIAVALVSAGDRPPEVPGGFGSVLKRRLVIAE
jgi:hypothetical protein